MHSTVVRCGCLLGLLLLVQIASSENAAELKNLIRANNLFSNELYKIIAESDGNIICSPLSIQLALSLLYLGTKGKTADELASGLHIGKESADHLEELKLLQEYLKSAPQISVASEAFIQQSLKLKETYKNQAKQYFGTESHLVNFKQDPEAARQYVNKWVSDQTRDKIQELFGKGSIDGSTRLVLASAVYFEAEWESKFDSGFTYNGTFHISEDRTVPLRMMSHEHAYFPYYKADSYQALQLPYKDSNFSMLILLPDKKNGLSELEKQLPNIDLQDLLSKLKESTVNVDIPKFTFDKSLELNEVLKKLNIKTMFGPEADLTEIYEYADGRLKVDQVVHKAYIEVAEDGTKAAAATGIAFATASLLIGVPEFTADHPFLFYILNRGVTVFVGRFIGP